MATTTLIPITGTAGACRATGQPRASWYRAHRQSRHHHARPARRRGPSPARLAPAGPGGPARRALLGRRAGQRLRHAAGRGQLPVFGLDDLPAAALRRRDRRPAPPRHPPAKAQARADGHRAQPVLIMGHHQARRPGQVDLVLPLRAPRHLQPLRGRLDGRRPPRTVRPQAIRAAAAAQAVWINKPVDPKEATQQFPG
jgi:hypothetical protein